MMVPLLLSLLLLLSKSAAMDRETITTITLQSHLTSAKAAAVKSLNLMHQRWEFGGPRLQFLLIAANMGKEAWDIIKYKVAKKFVGSFLHKQKKETQFLMIFGGSSVAAGHDNYYNQSFPFVCERRMKAAFDFLRIPLLVHNIAHGQNQCRPSNLCYNAMGGDHADWLGWEQSFNCGRDRGIFELMTRLAYWNKALLYFSASGGFSPGHCPKSNDTIPWISEEWSPEVEPMFQANYQPKIYRPYAPNHTNVLAFRDLLHAFYEENNAAARFVDGLGAYRGMASHGYSVWSKSKALCRNDLKNETGCAALDIMGDCQGRVGGVHWMTKEAGTFGAGPNHGGATHHPPWGMHVQRGEFIAYNMLHAVLDAIYMLENDLQQPTYNNNYIRQPSSHNQRKLLEILFLRYMQRLKKLQDFPLPEPSKNCGFECTTKPICYTDFIPHFNPNYTLDRIVIKGPGHTQLVQTSGSGNNKPWKRWVKNPSGGAPHIPMGYQDYKIYYESTGSDTSIHVHIKISSQSPYLRLCAQNMKESMKHAVFYLHQNITSTKASRDASNSNGTNDGDGMISSLSTVIPRIQLLKRRYVGDECTLLTEVPPGDHILTITNHPNNSLAKTLLSHIILYE